MKEYLHRIAAGYRYFFLKLCTAVLLLGVCLLFSFCIVYPLWLLAVQYTQVYTVATLSLFTLFLLTWYIKRCIKKYKVHPRRFLYSLVKKLILLAGFIGFFTFLFTYHRIAAFLTLILSLVVYGCVSFGYSDRRKPR